MEYLTLLTTHEQRRRGRQQVFPSKAFAIGIICALFSSSRMSKLCRLFPYVRRWLIILLVLSVRLGACAQQIHFVHPLPTTQMLGGNIGLVAINLQNADGSVATNLSAVITVTVTGPQNLSSSQINTATNGLAVFDFTSVRLNQVGLYAVAAAGTGLMPAFENIGVETTMMPPQGSIFAGAQVNPATTNGPQTLPALEQSCGRRLALSLHYYSWNDGVFASATNFTHALADDATNNRIPIISWKGTFLTNIVTGTEDGAISNAAIAMAAFQGPILVRWIWEMNLRSSSSSNWLFFGYPGDFSTPSPSQVAAAQTNFVTAWRRIRQIFDANGAANVVWLWNPGAGNDSAPGQTAGGYTDAFYPGDAFVDWIGLDAYNRLDDAFTNTYSVDASYGYTNMTAHAKPLIIGETGALNTNEAHQIIFFDSAASALQTNFPQLMGFTYFDAGGSEDWSLSNAGSTNGVTEFSNLVNNAYLNAAFVHPLSYSVFHPFSARVHVAPALTTLQGGIFAVGVSVDNLYSNTPSGTVGLYEDSSYLGSVKLTGGSNGYCQVQTFVTVTNTGVHSLVAVYSGDANNSPGQSWPVLVNVTAPPLTFQSIRVNGATIRLVWNAVSNQTYQVQFSTNLASAVWSNLGNSFLATNSTASATDSTSSLKKFYRILTLP